MNLRKLLSATLVLFFLLGIIKIQAQPFGSGSLGNVTISTSNTQVNQYTTVSGYSQGSSGYDIGVGNESYFAASHRAILIQMAGADAGAWEWVSILQITPGIVTVSNIVSNYTPGSGAVQLVFVPEYQDLTIASTGSLIPQTWNGTTGGVLSVMVAGTLTIQAGGQMNASGKGFQSGMAGVAGNGGLGGFGGTAPGGIGGSVGQVFNTGIGGGGHDGAGGGGGGANGSQSGANGTAGGNGGNGGNGGIGGAGGGLIITAANNLSLPNQVCFLANGLSGIGGQTATAGGPGGFGGIGGGGCQVGGGGGGGNGGDGGDGGNGGNGGAGGMIKIIRGASATAPASTHKQVLGATGGSGGFGGAGGAAGVNAGSQNGMPCGTGGTGTGSGGPSIGGGGCNAGATLSALQNMGAGGANNGTATILGNGFYFYTNGIDSIYVEEINPLTVIVHRVSYLGNTFTVVSGTGAAPSPLATIQQIFSVGNIPFSNSISGTVTGSVIYVADCTPVRNQPSPGLPGINGLAGVGANDGDSGDDVAADCSGISVSSSDVTLYDCAAQLPGSLIAAASGGTAPYSFTYGNTFDASGNFTATSSPLTLTAIDANGCTATIQAAVQEAPINWFQANNATDVTCFGGNNGSISIETDPSLYSGGPASFDIVDANYTTVFTGYNTQVVSGLAAGTYTIIQWACGYNNSNNQFTINEPQALVLNPTVTQPTCTTTGSVSLAVSGGTFPYTYLWSNNQTADNVTGLTGGTISVTVTDGNGCTFVDSFIINPSSNISASASSTASTCGQANGSATVMVTGAALPINYLWSNSSTASSITNLLSGNYSVTVTDGNGCTATAATTVGNVGVSLNVNLTAINATCGNGNGSITSTITNGTSPYTYLWSNGATSSSIINLAANTYSVNVTDAGGCTGTASSTIISTSSPINIFYDKGNNVACYGGSTGQIALSFTGGSSPYTYLWSNGQTGQSITGLAAGNYTITVTDANGCTASQTFPILQPATALTATAIGDTILCAGATGSINITGAGGNPAYSGTGIFSVSTGMNTFVVSDKNGCLFTLNWFVQTRTPPTVTIAATVACGGLNNGTATTTVTGGTPAYNYSWSTGAITANLTGLSSGKYFITVIDANGCIGKNSVEIKSSTAIIISGITTDAFCSPANSGAVNITVSDGQPTYTFNWSNAATTEDLTAVVAGNYTVTVTDALGCISSPATFTVHDGCGCPANFSAAICGPTEICQGENFTLTSQVMPRAQGYPYTYLWTRTPGTLTANTSATLTQNGLLAGTYNYTLTVFYTATCSTTAAYTVIVHPRPVIAVTNALTGSNAIATQLPGCNIILNATGGNYYNWTQGTSFFGAHTNQLVDGNTLIAVANQNRIYTVVGVDQYGCSGTNNITVKLSQLVITRSFSSAPAGPNTTVTGNVTPAYTNATYTWNGPGGYLSGPSTSVRNFTRINLLANLAGVYTATVIQNGCQQQISFTLTPAGTVFKTNGQIDILYADENEISLPSNIDKVAEVESKNEEQPFTVTLFPNPTAGVLKIKGEMPYQAFTTAQIFDMNGKLLLDFNLGDKIKLDEAIDVAELRAGGYLLQINNAGIKSAMLKFIKQ